jgi:hypothetical protein
MDDRYQNQVWWIRLWRRRHYIPVPFRVLVSKFRSPEEPLGLLWRIHIGLAQSSMKWYFTMAEVASRMRSRGLTRDAEFWESLDSGVSGSNDQDHPPDSREP